MDTAEDKRTPCKVCHHTRSNHYGNGCIAEVDVTYNGFGETESVTRCECKVKREEIISVTLLAKNFALKEEPIPKQKPTLVFDKEIT